MYCNARIYDVNHLANTLIRLECGSPFSEMKQEGISKLQYIKFLDFHGNNHIHNVNHLKDIEELYCGDRIDENGISELMDIKILSLEDNRKIKCINHLAGTLEKLICRKDQLVNKSDMMHTRVEITPTKHNIYSYSDKYKCDHLYSRYGMSIFK